MVRQVMSYKVLFCGTPEFAREQLDFLLQDPDYHVVTVVSQPDRPSGRGHKMMPSPVKEFALSKNLKVLTPEKASDPQFISEIQKNTYDVCIVVAYGQILKKNFLQLFPNVCVNVHASLLPRWRGAAPIQRSIMAGDIETGVCLQVVVPRLDAGAVIGERRLKISVQADAKIIHDELAGLSQQLLAVDLKKYLSGEVVPIEQDEALVTYAHKIEKLESDIDWRLSAQEIHNKVRGLTMNAYASCTFQKKRLKVLKTVPVSGQKNAGEVVEANGERLVIGCGKDCLQLLTVQPESKKPMAVAEFLKGYKISIGGHFEKQ